MLSPEDDPLVMYYVVRTGVPFTLGQAMEAAGAAAVECVERFGDDERFEAWHERPRKVALRAGDEEFGRVKDEEPCSVQRDVLLCLPPRRKSERSPLLKALQPFTDAPRPREEPPPPREDVPVMRCDEWREAGRPGELLTEGWERYREDPEAVVVSDAGHTQVAPGTETVIALVPSSRAARPA